jgi:hypothetical protein
MSRTSSKHKFAVISSLHHFLRDGDIEVGFCGSGGFAVLVILPILPIILSI